MAARAADSWAMSIDDSIKHVAAKVRHLRQAQNISLATLAERSGIAKSTLAQIETASSNPTLTTLINLADALSCTLEDLILGASDNTRMVVVRAGEGVDVSDANFDSRLVRSAMVGPSVIEFHAMRLHEGKSEVSASHGLGAREHVMVVKGKLIAGPIGEEDVTLKAGDYATYSADVPHRWIAVNGTAVFWVIVTYPRAANI